MVAEFWSTGLEPHAVSAISGTGTGEMLDVLAKMLPPPTGAEQDDDPDRPLAVAIVGRPNVGELWGSGRGMREGREAILEGLGGAAG